MKKRSKFKQSNLSRRNFFSSATENYTLYNKKHFSKNYLSLNGFQRNVLLASLKLTSLRFLGFSKSTGVSYTGVSYNQILSVLNKKAFRVECLFIPCCFSNASSTFS